MRRKNARRGFVLVELLATLSIIAVLIASLLPAVQNVRQSAARTAELYPGLTRLAGDVNGDLAGAERDLSAALELLPAVQKSLDPEALDAIDFTLQQHVALLEQHEAALRGAISSLGGRDTKAERLAVIDLHNQVVSLRWWLDRTQSYVHKAAVLADVYQKFGDGSV